MSARVPLTLTCVRLCEGRRRRRKDGVWWKRITDLKMFSTFRQNRSHTPGDTRGKGAAGTCPPQGPEPCCPGPQPRADFAQRPCVLWSPPPGRTPKRVLCTQQLWGGGRNKGPQGETESWGQAASASRTAGRKSSSGVRPRVTPGKPQATPAVGPDRPASCCGSSRPSSLRPQVRGPGAPWRSTASGE